MLVAKPTSKSISIEHEDYVARVYGGRRSPTSGGAKHDSGDVANMVDAQSGDLIECKARGRSNRPLKSKPIIVSQMEKINDEAWERGLEPGLALRYYLPNSPLANPDGWVDLIVRPLLDDVARMLFGNKTGQD